MSFLDGFIGSSDVISCPQPSCCVQIVGLCGKESSVGVVGWVDPKRDHQRDHQRDH